MKVRSFLLKLLSTIAFCVLFYSQPAQSAAGDVVEVINGNGVVNWSRGSIFVESTADENRSRYKACRASIVVAQRELVEIIGQLRVDSKTVVSEGVLAKDLILSTIRGSLNGGRVVGREINGDGTCTVKMSLALAGVLARNIFAKHNQNNQLKPAVIRQSVSIPIKPLQTALLPIQQDIIELKERLDGFEQRLDGTKGLLPQISGSRAREGDINDLEQRLQHIERLLQSKPELVAKVAKVVAEKIPTGLVIDARGSNFLPSMFPTLRDMNGTIVFPVAPSVASQNGELLALFMNDLSTAQNHPRVGSRPLVLKALRTWDDTRTEIILDRQASNRVTQLVKSGGMGHVPMIIVND